MQNLLTTKSNCLEDMALKFKKWFGCLSFRRTCHGFVTEKKTFDKTPKVQTILGSPALPHLYLFLCHTRPFWQYPDL